MGGFFSVLLSVFSAVLVSNSVLSDSAWASAPATAKPLSSSTLSSGIKCESLIQDLRSMQNAQQELLSSFTKKNETMAEVLDQHADRLEKNLILHQSLKKTDLRSLHISAEAFRGHQQKELLILDRFGKASGDLIQQVEACLTAGPKSEKIGQR